MLVSIYPICVYWLWNQQQVGVAHAVLAVMCDGEIYILDNNKKGIIKFKDYRSYKIRYGYSGNISYVYVPVKSTATSTKEQ